MKDSELQALWQAQPRGDLPVAFAPEHLSRRGDAAAALARPCGDVEAQHLAARARVHTGRLVAAVAVWLVVLPVAAALRTPVVAFAVLAGLLVVVAGQARALFAARRALQRVRALQERPREVLEGSPLVVVGALAFALMLPVLVVGMVLRPSPPPPVAPAGQPSAEAIDGYVADCLAAARRGEAALEEDDACDLALRWAPLHPEAVAAAREVAARRDCAGRARSATSLLALGDEAGALAAWGALPGHCRRRLAPDTSEATLVALGLRARDGCRRALDGGSPERLVEACQAYALLACDAPVVEPSSRTRPSHLFDFSNDEALRAFQHAATRQGRDRWRCPVPASPSRSPGPAPFVAESWPAALKPVLQAWAQGDADGARTLLAQADVPEARRAALQRDLDAFTLARAAAWSRLGERPADVDAAEAAVRHALELDARLVLGREATAEDAAALTKAPSRARRDLTQALGAAHHAQGKAFADDGDFRGACLAWKRGLAFTRSHLDLMKAVTNVCTPRARQALDDATTCEDLRRGLDYAVDGDGYQGRYEEKLRAGGCP